MENGSKMPSVCEMSAMLNEMSQALELCVEDYKDLDQGTSNWDTLVDTLEAQRSQAVKEPDPLPSFEVFKASISNLQEKAKEISPRFPTGTSLEDIGTSYAKMLYTQKENQIKKDKINCKNKTNASLLLMNYPNCEGKQLDQLFRQSRYLIEELRVTTNRVTVFFSNFFSKKIESQTELSNAWERLNSALEGLNHLDLYESPILTRTRFRSPQSLDADYKEFDAKLFADTDQEITTSSALKTSKDSVTKEEAIPCASAVASNSITSSLKITALCQLKQGKKLGICFAPNWEKKPISFDFSENGWKGQIPLNTDWKFVILEKDIVTQWEKGRNRYCKPETKEFTVQTHEIRF